MLYYEETMKGNKNSVSAGPDIRGSAKHLSWWPDWEFTNDLLLRPERPRLIDVALVARNATLSMDTVLEITFNVQNLSRYQQSELRVYAVVLDTMGILLTRGHAEAMTGLGALAPGQTQAGCITWQQTCPTQSYHLLLILEDEAGTMIDVVSGDYVLS